MRPSLQTTPTALVAAALFSIFLVACSDSAPGSSEVDAARDASADLAADLASDAQEPDMLAPDAGQPAFYLQLGPSQPSWLFERVKELLGERTTLPLVRADAQSPLAPPAGSVVLSVGLTSTQKSLAGDSDGAYQGLKEDGYFVRVRAAAGAADGVTRIICRGKKSALYGLKHNRADLYALYHALELLGLAFLHPLEPTLPQSIALPAADLDVARSPRWHIRGWQLHTMHPLELTDMLQGWGKTGPSDAKGFGELLAEWRLFLEWLLANGQLQVQWPLLDAPKWGGFGESATRLARLKQLVDIAHDYGIAVGVDVGIALRQQHTFRLIREEGDTQKELKQLRDRVDWLMGAGFDFLSTEIGSSEFTAPDDTKMLSWIDALGVHLRDKHGGKRAHIKVHVSTGQTAPNYKDPKTGKPINYNFLPQFAIKEIGVLPHTVQFYALDDPAPTYGNDDFAHIRAFMYQEAGKREVLWHPETAYWVSYDIDVPLFLPIYAERRLYDLRLIAADEDAGLVGEGAQKGSHIDGQIVFSSGWEWGYWLNDVVAARAAFDPQPAKLDRQAAFRRALEQALAVFGPAAKKPLIDALVKIADDQRKLLILGEVDGKLPADIVKRNGQAYMQGWEAFDDVGDMASSVPGLPKIQTQPSKLGLVSMRNPLAGGPSYQKEIRPLLKAMALSFEVHANTLEGIKPVVAPAALGLMQELIDAAKMNALRAKQLFGLYDYVDGLDLLGNPSSTAKKRLLEAQQALDAAQKIVAAREAHYRVPVARIAAWRDNPTAYAFSYLWTVHNLHYWWRDEGKAVKAPLSPCYLNIMDPARIAMGEGWTLDAADVAQKVASFLGLGSLIGDCLKEPTKEPTYPPKGLRGP